jgi:hypothetical protein
MTHEFGCLIFLDCKCERKKMKKTELDLNNPADARKFLKEALPQALPSTVNHVILQSGRKVRFDEMNDTEVVQYAWELLPIYKAKYPGLVNIHDEH